MKRIPRFYISKHPVEKKFEKKQYLGIFQLSNGSHYQPILVQFDHIKQIRTKNGQNMAFVTMNDGRTMMDGVIFPDKFKNSKLLFQRNRCISY